MTSSSATSSRDYPHILLVPRDVRGRYPNLQTRRQLHAVRHCEVLSYYKLYKRS